jgi:hypothetical protein
MTVSLMISSQDRVRLAQEILTFAEIFT